MVLYERLVCFLVQICEGFWAFPVSPVLTVGLSNRAARFVHRTLRLHQVSPASTLCSINFTYDTLWTWLAVEAPLLFSFKLLVWSAGLAALSVAFISYQISKSSLPSLDLLKLLLFFCPFCHATGWLLCMVWKRCWPSNRVRPSWWTLRLVPWGASWVRLPKWKAARWWVQLGAMPRWPIWKSWVSTMLSTTKLCHLWRKLWKKPHQRDTSATLRM